MKIGFDIISDLNLAVDGPFNWEGKATSLYCILAGNISHDIKTTVNVLDHLSNFYQGIFYVPGSLEYYGVDDIGTRTKELLKVCRKIRNIAVLYQHVVILDGVAIVGCNGWYGNTLPSDPDTEAKIQQQRHEDIHYLKHSIEKLQKHLDVTKIVLVTNSVPSTELYFGEVPNLVETQLPLNVALMADTENKVSHWIYGTNEKIVDTTINNINYINNACFTRSPYWAKRLDIDL